MSSAFPYRCIIYDLDGTLIDSRKDIASALNTGREHFGLTELNLAQVLPMIGHGLPNLVKKGFQNENVVLPEALAFVKTAYQNKPCRYSKTYTGVIETLQYFQQKAIIQYIVSNKPSYLIPTVLEKLHLKPYIKHAFGGEDFPERKPHPMAIQKILESEPHLSSKELLMVGDMSPDIEMAHRANIDSAFCLYGYSQQKLEATYTLHQFSDLTQLVQV